MDEFELREVPVDEPQGDGVQESVLSDVAASVGAVVATGGFGVAARALHYNRLNYELQVERDGETAELRAALDAEMAEQRAALAAESAELRAEMDTRSLGFGFEDEPYFGGFRVEDDY